MLRPLRLVLLLALAFSIPRLALADVVGTGSGTLCGEDLGLVVGNTAENFGSFTFDSGTRSVYGASIDLSSSVGGMTFSTTGTLTEITSTTASTTWFGSFTSDPPGSLSFTVPSGGGFTTGSLGAQSFIGRVDSLTESIGLPSGLAYTVDGVVLFLGSCDFSGPGAGDGLFWDLEIALNAFQPQLTPTGSDVTVSGQTTFFHPVDGSEVTTTVDVTFASVASGGETTVSAQSETLAVVPPNFSVAVGDTPVVYLDITTTADVSGPITVCGPYADANDDGVVDGTEADPVLETSLRVLHDEGGTFVDRTDFGLTDYASNILCGTVSSLSLFVVARDLEAAPPDADGDGVPDDVDVCPGGDDNLDSDGDGVPDACDPCPLDPQNDADGDGVCGDIDTCPGGDDSLNTDGDALPDFCDVCPLDPENDADADGLCESVDNCPLTANSGQSDLDGDGVGDACDPDLDGDGVDNDLDNCRFDFNPDQADADGDGAGDECDADDDGDGVVDADDACVPTPLGAVVDASGCSIAQLCPCAHPLGGDRWKNHGGYVSCVAHTSEDFLAAGLIDSSEKDATVAEAGDSTCGHKVK